jgi:hypothetical protein
MTRDYILDNEGKFDLGAKLTGISLRLVNAKLAFETRLGPTWAECQVSGGNLAATDSGGSAVWPIEFTDYTSVTFESDVSAALIPGTGGLTPSQEVELTTAATESTSAHTEAAASAIDAALARKLDSNKAIVSPDDLTVTVYDDNGVDILYVFDISADKRQRVPQ